MPLSAGDKLGPYEILSPLGAGGMGEVYRARDSRLGREVAVKVLPERLANDAQARARFEREGKAVAALSHPNILVLFDIGEQQGIHYAVTELLEGETLRDRLSRSTLSWRKTVELGVALAEGLAAAHGKGIVHRDIKPGNIFLTADGQVKILDFGVAQWRQRCLPKTKP
jgi:eukaryotic-like serine/threonine-protein kinase